MLMIYEKNCYIFPLKYIFTHTKKHFLDFKKKHQYFDKYVLELKNRVKCTNTILLRYCVQKSKIIYR